MTEEFLFERLLSDGRMVSVDLLTFGRARLAIGPAFAPWYDDGW